MGALGTGAAGTFGTVAGLGIAAAKLGSAITANRRRKTGGINFSLNEEGKLTSKGGGTFVKNALSNNPSAYSRIYESTKNLVDKRLADFNEKTLGWSEEERARKKRDLDSYNYFNPEMTFYDKDVTEIGSEGYDSTKTYGNDVPSIIGSLTQEEVKSIGNLKEYEDRARSGDLGNRYVNTANALGLGGDRPSTVLSSTGSKIDVGRGVMNLGDRMAGTDGLSRISREEDTTGIIGGSNSQQSILSQQGGLVTRDMTTSGRDSQQSILDQQGGIVDRSTYGER